MKLEPCSKTYGHTKVLDFSGAELESGKIYGILGTNGSGKSTFARILAGTLQADRPYHPAQNVGYLPQKPYAFRLSTKANLCLNGDESRARALMEALQITHLSEKPAHRLSGGETARMALARILMKPYDLLILDEPTAAMDLEATNLAEAVIRTYVQETGCTLLLVTHSLRQARRLTEHVLFFHRGSLVETGRTEQVLTDPMQVQTKRFLEFCAL